MKSIFNPNFFLFPDQCLVYLMFACDHFADEKLQFGLWGERSVRQLEVKRFTGKTLRNATTFSDIMEVIDPALMTASILHFPLMRSVAFDQVGEHCKHQNLILHHIYFMLVNSIVSIVINVCPGEENQGLISCVGCLCKVGKAK